MFTSELFVDDDISKSLFEGLADILTDPLYIVDEDEKLLAINRAALKQSRSDSLAHFNNASKQHVSNMFLKEKGCFVPESKKWMAPLGERTPIVALKDSNGNSHPYRLRVQPFIIGGQNRFIVYLHDIEMVHKAKQAQHYFESFKQQFLTNISHEFRTPMNSIIGFTGLLEQTKIDTLQRDYVANIQKSAGTMLENIENLLDLMEIESGAQTIRREPFKVYKELEAFSRTFCAMAEEKKVSLFFMIDPHLPETMIGDIESIKKVMRNLISNAIKFTTAGGQVLVEFKVIELGRKTVVRYAVTDSGEGIAKEKLQTLLRPFAATRENKVKGKEGFGVGLTLAFKLLRMIGSELSVASEVGKGSRFSFTLRHGRVTPAPYQLMKGSRIAVWAQDRQDIIQLKILKRYLKLFGVDAHELLDVSGGETLRNLDALFMLSSSYDRLTLQEIHDAQPELKVVPVIAPELENDFLNAVSLIEDLVTFPLLPSNLYRALSVIWKHTPKGLIKPEPINKEETGDKLRKILVAEDNPINQKLIVTILQQQGYTVTTAENGQIAVDFYENGTFDAILMDIDMPVMDGISATRVIKEIDRRDKRPFTPVIALTARALAGDRERILSAGLDAHLSKPVDREFLLSTLDQYLKMKDERNKKMQFAV